MESKKRVDFVIALLLLISLLVLAEYGNDLSGMVYFENETQVTTSSSTTSSSSSTISTSSSSSTTSSTSSSSSSSTITTTTSSTSSTSTTTSSSTSTTTIEEIETFIGKNYRRKPSGEAENNWVGSKKIVFSGGQKISANAKDQISGRVVENVKERGGISLLLLILIVLLLFVYKKYRHKNIWVMAIGLVVFLSLIGYLSLSGNVTLESVSNYSYYEIDNIVIGDSLSESELTDSELDGFQDDEVSFAGQDINIHDELALGRITSSTSLNTSEAIKIQSSLTSKDYDYEDNLYMEVLSGVINYHYLFDETVDLNKVSSSDPLEINFLGKTLSINKINSANEFKTSIGNENFMEVGDSKIVNGKEIILKNIGDTSILVEVNSVTEIVELGGTKNVNGIQVNLDSVFYSYNMNERSAMVRIGDKVSGVYQDGDGFIGENETSVNWVWDIGELTTVSSGDSNSGSGGPTVGIKNDFSLTNEKNAIKRGECLAMPNNYVDICFDSIEGEKKAEYLIHYDESCSLESKSNEKCIVIETSIKNGLVISNGDYRTRKILLNFNETLGKMDVYFKNSANQIELASTIDTSSDVRIGEIRYEKTSGDNIEIHLLGTSDVANNMELDLQVNGDGRASSGRDDLHILLSHSTSDFSGLQGIEWGSDNLNLASVDEVVMGYYGYSLIDPEEALNDDKLRLKIPERQIKATVTIRTNQLT